VVYVRKSSRGTRQQRSDITLLHGYRLLLACLSHCKRRRAWHLNSTALGVACMPSSVYLRPGICTVCAHSPRGTRGSGAVRKAGTRRRGTVALRHCTKRWEARRRAAEGRTAWCVAATHWPPLFLHHYLVIYICLASGREEREGRERRPSFLWSVPFSSVQLLLALRVSRFSIIDHGRRVNR